MSTLATAVLAAATSTTVFSDYPGFVDSRSVVEAYTDRGPIIEVIIKCSRGSGILTYSKIERLYCSSRHTCFPSLKAAARDTCG